jgi:hypothetical protein
MALTTVPRALAPSAALQYGNWTPALFVPYRRSIGGIIAQVTIDEQHTDEIQITDHPVERGPNISDHAFKRPVQVNITAGWSQAVAFDLSAETGVYGLLLSWQAAFMPFDIVTGKRRYTNMLIERIVVTTDQHNEFTLMAQIACRQVIIAQTQTTEVTTKSANNGDQKEPDKTAAKKDNGEKPAEKPAPAETTKTEAQTVKDSPPADLNEKGLYPVPTTDRNIMNLGGGSDIPS